MRDIQTNIKPNTQYSKYDTDIKALITPELQRYRVDYVTYGRYSKNAVNFYTTDQPLLQRYLIDKKCILPTQVSQQPPVFDWSKYCSEDFLSLSKLQFYYNPMGATILLQHHNFSEHISLATRNSHHDLTKLILENPEIKKHIVCHIRNTINLNKNNYERLAQTHTIAQPQQLTASKSETHIDAPYSHCDIGRQVIYGHRGQTYLTLPETQSLSLLLQLKSYGEIATLMGISSKTVGSHISRIRKKLGAHMKSELYKIAYNNSIL